MAKSTVTIPVDDTLLKGVLRILPKSSGLVLFAHGSGSGYLSPRNNFVADALLSQAKIDSLLFDLLTEDEDLVYENRFNLELLTYRLIEATKWAQKQPGAQDLKLGYFGASTGAAAAIKAAARLGTEIKAIVSRGGRPDLAMCEIEKVHSPILLIVGGNDPDVIELNKKAYGAINCTKRMEIVPEATHLFEEPGALENVSKLATSWFKKYLTP